MRAARPPPPVRIRRRLRRGVLRPRMEAKPAVRVGLRVVEPPAAEIAEAGAISPLVNLLGGERGDAAQACVCV